jgi:hypothetical protein
MDREAMDILLVLTSVRTCYCKLLMSQQRAGVPEHTAATASAAPSSNLATNSSGLKLLLTQLKRTLLHIAHHLASDRMPQSTMQSGTSSSIVLGKVRAQYLLERYPSLSSL